MDRLPIIRRINPPGGLNYPIPLFPQDKSPKSSPDDSPDSDISSLDEKQDIRDDKPDSRATPGAQDTPDSADTPVALGQSSHRFERLVTWYELVVDKRLTG